MLQQYPSAQQGTPYQVQGQTASPGMNHIQSGMEKHSDGHAKFSSIEVQLSMQSPVLTTPLYATAGTYMPSGNPFYPNFQPSGVYALHYNAGGYALNSAFLPAFVAGYPPHGPVPMPFDATSGPSINIQTTGISTAENIPHMCDLQHQKFYGHHVMMLQPSFVNPLQTQYFQHPFGDAYGASVQYVRLPSSNGTGAQVDSSILKEPPSATYLGDQKLLSPPNGSLGIPNPRKLGIALVVIMGFLQAWVSWHNFQYCLFLVHCCHHYQLVEKVIQVGEMIKVSSGLTKKYRYLSWMARAKRSKHL